MRDIFEDVFKNQPLDPTEVARRAMRPQLRRRFYQRVEIEAVDDAFRIVLDGRPVRTPARHALAAPTRALAQALFPDADRFVGRSFYFGMGAGRPARIGERELDRGDIAGGQGRPPDGDGGLVRVSRQACAASAGAPRPR